ncbi:MAG: primosomal protein N' [Isosphaeraceae bacterium]
MSAVNRKGKRPSSQAALFDTAPDGPFAGVVFNRPLDDVFTYRIPEEIRSRLKPGARVAVPLGRGNTSAVGYVVRVDEVLDPESGLDPARIKDVADLLDDPPLIDAAMLELTRWIASYYLCSWGQALDAVVPAGVKKGAGTRIRVCLTVPDEVRLARETLKLTSKQAEILDVVCKADDWMTVEDACRLVGCKPSIVLTLRKKGLLRTVRRRVDRGEHAASTSPETGHDGAPPAALTGEQEAVLGQLAPALDAKQFSTFLLHGVTGSGKTEVYLQAIERVVAAGREAIVLVPEISLTPQTIRRFRRRFDRVAVLHSHLTDAERHRHWRAIAGGEVQVVVGARSAIFAPARKLGLIVIDEEHESTFKQETTPRYHARDVAVKGADRGAAGDPGVGHPAETWQNCERKRFTRLTLARRVADRPMPEVALIDLRNEKPEPGRPIGGLSAPLRRAIEQALDDDGQVILLLNRRGFHTFILCPGCGHVVKCDSCDVALTHHKQRGKALCHTCDAERDPPQRCPQCGNQRLHFGGIGTERLEREVKEAFFDRVVRRMDSDTMRSPGSHEQTLGAFRKGQVDILLGTQMIAKGLDFPDVTLVGVVNADTGLHLPDFRAAERTFQLVAQVAGRTGRGDRPGKVLVQTFCPDHPAIALAARHDYLAFVAGELPHRRESGRPPFGRLVRLIARGPDEGAVGKFIQEVAMSLAASAPPGVQIMGPAPAPVVKIRDLFRFHVQLRGPEPRALLSMLRECLPALAAPRDVELAVDVDPMSLL